MTDLSDEISNFFLGLHLFLEVISLQEVGQLGVVVFGGAPVELQQGLEY